jgi:hypothetical protein
MNAIDALRAAQAAGIQVQVDGDDLIIFASAEPSAEVLSLLTSHKAAIMRVLRTGPDGWSAKAWQEFFEERASIAEFDGGLLRDQAEVRAFSCCVGEWLHRHPVSSERGRCDYCQLSNGVLLPYLTAYSISNPGHTWLHRGCSRVWHSARRAKAVDALAFLLPNDFQKTCRVKSFSRFGTGYEADIPSSENSCLLD